MVEPTSARCCQCASTGQRRKGLPRAAPFSLCSLIPPDQTHAHPFPQTVQNTTNRNTKRRPSSANAALTSPPHRLQTIAAGTVAVLDPPAAQSAIRIDMSSQRPFFLSTFFAAFRQTPASLSSASSSAQPPNKHTTQASTSVPQTSTATPRSISSTAAAAAASQAPSPPSRAGGVLSQLPLHSPRHHHHHHHHHSAGIPIPQPQGHRDNNHGRRRGSDSSSEGFREALGAEKLYIGGRTAAGEERFFKLGVVRRIKSGDRLSLDRLSL